MLFPIVPCGPCLFSEALSECPRMGIPGWQSLRTLLPDTTEVYEMPVHFSAELSEARRGLRQLLAPQEVFYYGICFPLLTSFSGGISQFLSQSQAPLPNATDPPPSASPAASALSSLATIPVIPVAAFCRLRCSRQQLCLTFACRGLCGEELDLVRRKVQ